MTFRGKTLFITGASRGIGLAIALAPRATAPTSSSPPRRPSRTRSCPAPSTRGRGDRGGRRQGAAPASCDIRDEEQVARGRRSKAVETFGGIDILRQQRERDQPHRHARDADEALRPDARRQHARHLRCARRRASRTCMKAANPHILNISPPLNMEPKWFAPHVAYTMAKFGMSMCVLGMAEEFRGRRHRRQRAVAAHRHRHRRGAEPARRRRHDGRGSRKPEIMADAAYAILTATQPRAHRQLLHRRRGAARRGRDRLSTVRGRRRRDAAAADFFVPDAVFDTARQDADQARALKLAPEADRERLGGPAEPARRAR